MAKNANYVSHKKSRLKNQDGSPQLPSASALVEGEIAINFAENVETLSIKNDSGHVVTFSSDNYYTEKKLGSGFTGANSANTVTSVVGSGFTSSSITDVIIENEEIVSAALTDLDERKLDASAYTPSVELWVSGTGENAIVQKNGGNTASGKLSVAMGSGTTASENYSVAEGFNTAGGYACHAEGFYTIASGYSSHAEGYYTIANNESSHAEGSYTSASGPYSHAEGSNTKASGQCSHAEGYYTTASSESSHAEGYYTKANGYYSHAEGNNTTASGQSSHAEGYYTKASGEISHAEGSNTKASGQYSHAEGSDTTASGQYSHAEGCVTIANGQFSHTEGFATVTKNDYEHASGQYNNSVSASTTFGDSGNTLFSVGNGTASDARHNAFEIRQNGDIYLSDGTKLQDAIDITIDQVIDSGTSASTNAVATKAVYKAITDNELVWTNAFVALSGITSAHTANTEIHVTAADKTAWNAKVDASAIADFFDDAKYEDSGTTKVINFYHGNTIKATIDASDFIVDGMVDDVRIENGNLVIDFNTASGKQDISIPLTDIFDPSNYYNKTAIDNLVGSGFTSSSITDVIIENEEIVSAALTDLDERKLDASAYTPTDLSNYYTKSETSGATEISNALGGKVNSATYTGHTADTTVHFTTGTVQTQIDNSISGKVNTSDIISAITPSNSGSTAPIATNVVAENELVVSNALTDLDDRKLDASAYTPTDLSNYYTKSETSGATEISNALGGKVNTSDVAQVVDSTVSANTNPVSAKAVYEALRDDELVFSQALNDLNSNKADTSAITEVNNAISSVNSIVGSGYTNTTITDVIENMDNAIAAALTDVNDKIGDIESILATI